MLNIPDGKCPSCTKTVHELTIDSVPASVGYGHPKWNAVTYCCPHCKVVLGAGIDPVALKTDTIDGILKGLGR